MYYIHIFTEIDCYTFTVAPLISFKNRVIIHTTMVKQRKHTW